MDPQIGRAGFRIACYVAMVSGTMLFFLRPGTAEFVVAALSLLVGLLFGAVVAVLVWVSARSGRTSGDLHLPPKRR